MAANTIGSNGTGTLPVSGPGVQSSVTVTDVNVVATDRIILTLTKRVKNQWAPFDAYVSSIGTGTFIVKSNQDQLPETLTFNYIAVKTA